MNVPPRDGRLPWDDTFMLTAYVASGRSPDPNTQVGACIVDKNNKIVATGYNAFPRKICPTQFSWAREAGDPLKTKYPFVVHAEDNAIHNKTKSLEGGTLYVTMFPCNECAKGIIQEGIARVVYLDNPYKDGWQARAALEMLSVLDIKVEQHTWSQEALNFLSQLSAKLLSKSV